MTLCHRQTYFWRLWLPRRTIRLFSALLCCLYIIMVGPKCFLNLIDIIIRIYIYIYVWYEAHILLYRLCIFSALHQRHRNNLRDLLTFLYCHPVMQTSNDNAHRCSIYYFILHIVSTTWQWFSRRFVWRFNKHSE